MTNEERIEKKRADIINRWLEDFNIKALLGNDKVKEYRIAREILDIALFHNNLTVSELALLHKIQIK